MKTNINRTLVVKNIITNITNMKTYFKYLCAVLLVIGTCAHAWGQAPSLLIEEKVAVYASDFTNYTPGGANGATVGVVSVSTTANYKNDCNSKPYIRLTASSTMTVTASQGKLTKIVFSPMSTAGCGGNGTAGRISVNTGSWDGNDVWTSAAGVTSVTFTATNVADFRDFTATLEHSSSSCPFTFPTSISFSVASGNDHTETVNITETTGYTWNGSGLSNYNLGGSSETAELTDFSASSNDIYVVGVVPGTYYGTLDVEYQRYTPFSYYSISIPITVTVTGCADISGQTVTVNTVPAPTYNCSTDKWETTVSWNTVPGASRYGLQLQVYDGGWTNSGAAVYVSAPTTSYTYTNLTSGNRYRVGVAAQNQSCVPNTNTSATASSEFNTTCPSITDLGATVTGILSNSANLSWSATPGICTTTYSVWVSANSDYSSPVWTQTASANTTHSLSGLSSNTLYYVKITAFNECGNSQTRTGTFTTAKELVDYRYMCVDLNLVKTDDGANPIAITSAAGQSVKAARTLTLNVNGATPGGTVTLSGTGLEFYETDGTLISSGLTTDPSTGSITNKEIVVAYAPTAYVDETLLTPDIRVNVDGNNVAFQNLVKVRCLPDNFVIAAKLGNYWYALPADITTSSSNTSGILIDVDDASDPTIAYGPSNKLKYGLRNVASSRLASNGTNLVFTERLSTSTADNQKTLYNGSSTSIQVNAQYSGYHGTNPTKYEWVPSTSDLKDYTLTSAAEARTASLNTSGVWGTLTEAKAYDGKIRLLPLSEWTDMQAEVMEWGTSSLALRFAGDVPDAVDITLGANTWSNKTLTNITAGGVSDLYSVSGLTLTGDNCQVMKISDHDNASRVSLIRKPILVSGTDATSGAYKTALTDAVCEGCDIVVLSTGKLTANQTKATHTSFANLYVYPGGKLVLDGNSLGVKNKVYVRGGYSWLSPNTYALPEVYLNGDIKFEGSNNIIYDYYIHNYQYYQFCLPYQVPLAKVTDEAGIDNFPVWVKHYNGALRAANADATSWDWYNGTNFEAGVGYIIAARPRQVEKVQNRPLSIIRFPLTNSAFNGSGEAQKSVSTTAHGIGGYNLGTVTANNVGWNLIGNPYMATWKGNIGHSQLEKHPNVENWDGTYHWKDGATKYVTVMSAENGSSYDQYVASTTELKPFFPFFIQETASGGTGTVTFTLGNRMKKMPALLSSETMREAFVQIDMTDGESQDQTGVYVSNKYSDDLDFDDYEKMFGSLTTKPRVWIMHESTRMAFEAMSEERAAGSVPVGYRAPEEGEYTFTLSDYSNLENVESVLLNDSEEGVYNYDLLNADYTFSSTKSIYNDTRFSIRIVMKQETPSVITGTETIELKSEKPQKFIWQNKMYILRGGVLYDATGKKVGEINK